MNDGYWLWLVGVGVLMLVNEMTRPRRPHP